MWIQREICFSLNPLLFRKGLSVLKQYVVVLI